MGPLPQWKAPSSPGSAQGEGRCSAAVPMSSASLQRSRQPTSKWMARWVAFVLEYYVQLRDEAELRRACVRSTVAADRRCCVWTPTAAGSTQRSSRALVQRGRLSESCYHRAGQQVTATVISISTEAGARHIRTCKSYQSYR